MTSLYFMLACEIVIFIMAYKVSENDLMAPSVISIFAFIFATIGIIYNKDYWDVNYTWKTSIIVIFTLISIFLAQCISLITTKGAKSKLSDLSARNKERIYIEIPFFINLIIIYILCVMMVYYVYQVYSKGMSLGATGLSVIGVTKYDETKLNFVSRFSLRVINIFYFIYAYIVINNTVTCKKKLTTQIFNILPIIFGFCIMFFSGSRKMLVQYPMALVLMFVIINRDMQGRKVVSTKKLMKVLIPVCMFILGLFYGMREISKASTALADRTFIDYLTYYISSPLYLLDKFIQNPLYVNRLSTHFGEFTFLGFYNSLKSWGIFDFEIPNNNYLIISSESYMAGNEFTWIQRPYLDFGLWGMLLFTFVVFYIYNKIYYKKIVCKEPSKKRDLIIILYSYFYFIVVLSFYCAYTITEFTIQSVFYAGIIAGIFYFIVLRKKWNKELEEDN